MTENTEPLDLDAIRARAEAATPGPWEAGIQWVYSDGQIYADDNRVPDVLGMEFADPDRAEDEARRGQRNAEFIAAARTDVPTLLAEVKRLRAERDAAREALARVGALVEALDGRLLQVADGTWSAAQFIDFTADIVTRSALARPATDEGN